MQRRPIGHLASVQAGGIAQKQGQKVQGLGAREGRGWHTRHATNISRTYTNNSAE
jgi:hypothetical protein